MKATIIQMTITLLFTTSCYSCSGNSAKVKNENMSILNDSLVISEKTFIEKVRKYYGLMAAQKDVDIDTMLDIIRVYNSIGYVELQPNQLYKDYENIFNENYLDKAVEMLKATMSRGMGYYSKAFEIDIGGTPRPNSMYKVKD